MMRRTPLKRSSFKRKPRKKLAGYSEKIYLDACKGQPCYLRIKDVCGGASASETVVPAHSNQAKHGKGMGIKAKDIYTVPACMYCHSYIDQGPAPKAEKFSLWDAAYEKWVKRRDEILGDAC